MPGAPKPEPTISGQAEVNHAAEPGQRKRSHGLFTQDSDRLRKYRTCDQLRMNSPRISILRERTAAGARNMRCIGLGTLRKPGGHGETRCDGRVCAVRSVLPVHTGRGLMAHLRMPFPNCA